MVRDISPRQQRDEADGWLHITRRWLPHWRLKGSVYFITWRTKGSRPLTPEERTRVLKHVRAQSGIQYDLVCVVVMPDHVHIVPQPYPEFSLAQAMRGIRGCASRAVNELRQERGSVWQREPYDRIVRDDEELLQKIGYIIGNPVAADLVEDPWDYPWLYLNDRFGS
jgi:REP element-mobilizing transposase RayT